MLKYKMLKNKMYIISIVIMCLLVGCGNSNIEQNDNKWFVTKTDDEEKAAILYY